MLGAIICTEEGPVVITTRFDSLLEPELLEHLARKEIIKFVGFEVPIDLVRERYGKHYELVMENIHESDELRVIDENGRRVFSLFSFDEVGPPVLYESAGRPQPVMMKD